MITVVAETGKRCESMSFATRHDAMACMARAASDVVVFDNGVPIAFRFLAADEVRLKASPEAATAKH